MHHREKARETGPFRVFGWRTCGLSEGCPPERRRDGRLPVIVIAAGVARGGTDIGRPVSWGFDVGRSRRAVARWTRRMVRSNGVAHPASLTRRRSAGGLGPARGATGARERPGLLVGAGRAQGRGRGRGHGARAGSRAWARAGLWRAGRVVGAGGVAAHGQGRGARARSRRMPLRVAATRHDAKASAAQAPWDLRRCPA